MGGVERDIDDVPDWWYWTLASLAFIAGENPTCLCGWRDKLTQTIFRVNSGPETTWFH